MFWVYVTYNKKHGKFYIGQTRNLNERIELHNNKTFNKSYTSRCDGIWVLIYKEKCINRKLALAREKQLKSYRGREFIKKYIPR